VPVARRLISSGSEFEKQIGYSRAVVAGDWIMVSGTTGFDYATMTISADVVEQTEQCLKNIEAALRQADSSLKDVVRVTYVLAGAQQVLWRRASRGDDDFGRTCGSAYEDRDRGYGVERGVTGSPGVLFRALHTAVQLNSLSPLDNTA
jgi:enamine deaminase RidA (YjgF/YER057c/UK114 family)